MTEQKKVGKDWLEDIDIAVAATKLSERVHSTAIEKGWWNGNYRCSEPGLGTGIVDDQGNELTSDDVEKLLNDRNDGELLMLIVTELAEACEGLRHGNGPSDHIPEFSFAEEELADAVIRIADMCAARGWRLGEAIVAKMAFNKGRSHKHGGKKF